MFLVQRQREEVVQEGTRVFSVEPSRVAVLIPIILTGHWTRG